MEFYEESDECEKSVSSKHSRKIQNTDLAFSRIKKNILSIKI